MIKKNEERITLFHPDGPDEIDRTMRGRKRIALIAHDNRKKDLLNWVKYNLDVLVHHDLVGTGTTGKIISDVCRLPVELFQSGPLGGDQQIGTEISYGKIDILIFFWDPMLAQPHDPDVKALLRLSVLYNVPTACNRATADFLIGSDLFHTEYQQKLINYAKRRPPIQPPE
jgi:methylglyoxal synthase